MGLSVVLFLYILGQARGHDIFSQIPNSREDLVDTSRCVQVTCNNTTPVPLTMATIDDPIIVQSPNFPANYPPNTRCEFLIYIPANYILRIEPVNYTMGPGDKVWFDVFVSGNIVSESPVISTATILNMDSRAYGGTFKVVFTSDGTTEATGFLFKIYGYPAPLSTRSCRCGGIWLGTNRIVNGSNVNPGQIPYQALILQTGSSAICSGALITRNYVLTTAKCVSNKSGLSVVLGEYNTAVADGEVSIPVANVIVNPNYNPATLENNIALVQLSTLSPMNPSIFPICLPAAGTIFDGKVLTVSGWGYTTDSSSYSSTLKFGNMLGLSTATCTSLLTTTVPANSICAVPYPGTDICYGDGGDPLAYGTATKWTLAGLAHFLAYPACSGNPAKPSGFVGVSNYIDWINNNSDAIMCSF